MKKNISIALTSLLLSTFAFAEPCVLKIKRTACPGKNEEAYKPYGGKTETEETKDLKDVAACEKAAKKAADIVRKDILDKKEVVGTFAGKPLKEATYVGNGKCKK